jgi:hypothetical protein
MLNGLDCVPSRSLCNRTLLMTLVNIGIFLCVIGCLAVIALWGVESKLKQIIGQLENANENLQSVIETINVTSE